MKIIFSIFSLLCLLLLKHDKVVIKLGDKPEIFACDNFDNVYIYSKQTLKKFNSSGKLESQNSSLGYGNVYSVDVSDPFQILLFYKEFNTVAILDNKLNIVGDTYQLDKFGFSTVEVVCKSKQFGFWILDSYAQKLMLYSLNTKGFIREIDLSKYTKPLYNLDNMIESGDQIYLFGKEKAVLVFNELGSKLDILDVYPKTGFQVINGNLIYNNESLLFKYKVETNQLDSFKIGGFENFEDIKTGNEKIFVLNKDSVTILQKPIDF
jgi:hypothetical protein